MPTEIKPTILLVGNAQTSKSPDLPTSDLLLVPAYKGIVDHFDRESGLSPLGSLGFERQIASMVMSVAAHTAFIDELNNRVNPGLLDPRNRRYDLIFTGHSIGEMGALIEAGVCDISTMARMLKERERITRSPLQAGMQEIQQPLVGAVRRMLAIVGAHPDEVDAHLGQLAKRFTRPAQIFLANRNTKKQAVVGLEISEGEAENLLENLGTFISELTDPITRRPIFPRIKLYDLGLENAFHTALMQYEELLYIRAINSRLTDKNFIPPQERTVYSPTLPGWVSSSSLEPTFNVIKHIITQPVQFMEGVEEWKQIPNLIAVVTADVKKTVPNLLRDNGMTVPILNIVDRKSLGEAINKAEELIKN